MKHLINLVVLGLYVNDPEGEVDMKNEYCGTGKCENLFKTNK